ncbi:hypothetical protein B0H13DRAFT_1859455 [Mycena leptocephala]|nr:hypothetical protein B0H13DRAFT_1859455 [Mycena leptocephala]
MGGVFTLPEVLHSRSASCDDRPREYDERGYGGMREKGYGKRSRGEFVADRKRWRREAVLGSFFEPAARWGARFIQRKEGVRKEVPDDGHDPRISCLRPGPRNTRLHLAAISIPLTSRYLSNTNKG